MKLYREESQQVIKQICDSINCNSCGKGISVMEPESECMEGGTFTCYFGYGSARDDETHEFELCDACYDKLMDSFVVPVHIKEDY